MTTSTTNPMKRKRYGNGMPTIRERIDEETGSLITVQIETTKDAKKRRRNNDGAQWKPTAGQINAADIWNKQEEKIKRDREREERKKRTAARQAEKDAKAKELQEELLRKGKISVEDTWGKVSSSQVRLNKFFGAPKASKQPPEAIEWNKAADNHVRTNTQKDETESQFYSKKNVVENELATLLSDSPSMQDNSALSRSVSGKTVIRNGRSGYLMPPPPPPQSMPLQSQRAIDQVGVQHTSSASTAPPPLESNQKPRRPLSELSPSHINSRMSKQSVPKSAPSKQVPQAQTSAPPLSTQVILETLDGISSQDFVNDLDEDSMEDKENLAVRPGPEGTFEHGKLDKQPEQDSFYHVSEQSGTTAGIDDFCDDEIDDETLLYFAATQRVKIKLNQSPKDNAAQLSPRHPRLHSSKTKMVSSNVMKSPTASSHKLASGDSFAFTDVDDEDLVRCVEEFEGDTDDLDDEDLLRFMEDFEAENGLSEQCLGRKKQRVLPWVKSPVQYSSQETVLAFDSNTQSFQEW